MFVPTASDKMEDNNKQDTVTLARQIREQQGLWEVEVSYGGETDLNRQFNICTKNPGHLTFIPVDQLSVNDLPPSYHDSDLVEWIRAMSDRTVRISVKYVSEDRPETYPESVKPYPCYKNRGNRKMVRVGTGCVSMVVKYPEDICKHLTTCDCEICLECSIPKAQFAHIYINTATHVVFDKSEAENTTCHLFFDKGAVPETCSGAVKLSGMSCEYSDIMIDRCLMKCVTYDLDLATKLEGMVNNWMRLSSQLKNKYEKISGWILLKSAIWHKMFILMSYLDLANRIEKMVSNWLFLSSHFKDRYFHGKRSLWSLLKFKPMLWERLVIIVSHPHGSSKKLVLAIMLMKILKKVSRTLHQLVLDLVVLLCW